MQEAINQTELINLVQQGVQQALATSSTPPHSSPDYTPPSCVPALEEISTTPSTVSANSVTSDLTMQTIQQQMQMMQKMMEILQEKQQPPLKNLNGAIRICRTSGMVC